MTSLLQPPASQSVGKCHPLVLEEVDQSTRNSFEMALATKPDRRLSRIMGTRMASENTWSTRIFRRCARGSVIQGWPPGESFMVVVVAPTSRKSSLRPQAPLSINQDCGASHSGACIVISCLKRTVGLYLHARYSRETPRTLITTT